MSLNAHTSHTMETPLVFKITIQTATTGIPNNTGITGNTGIISGIKGTEIDWSNKVPCRDSNVITVINSIIACAMAHPS